MKQGTENQKGFTLIELMVVVAVVGVLVTVAVPGMRDLIENNRVTGYTNEFLSSVWLARSEAIKRGSRVTLCRSSNATNCETGNGGWEVGWVVFANSNAANNNFTAADVIQQHDALSGQVSLTGQNTVGDYLSFLPDGSAETLGNIAQSGDITLNLNGKGRRISLSRVGNVSVAKTP